MIRSKIDRQLVINNTISLFQEKGYNHTSMEDIAHSCYIQKSSLYHHIPSRKALVMLVIKQILKNFKTDVSSIVHDSSIPQGKKCTKFIQAFESFFTNNGGGHLLCSLALELNRSMPDLKPLIQEHYSAWKEALKDMFCFRHTGEQALILAEDAVSKIQGAIVLEHIYGRPHPTFHRLIEQLLVLKAEQAKQPEEALA